MHVDSLSPEKRIFHPKGNIPSLPDDHKYFRTEVGKMFSVSLTAAVRFSPVGKVQLVVLRIITEPQN